MQGGDSSCFLFNLTQNLRFNAREGKAFYISASKNEIKFGDTDLVIRDLNNVTSSIRKPDAVNPSGGPQGQSHKMEFKNLSPDMIGGGGPDKGSTYFFGSDLI